MKMKDALIGTVATVAALGVIGSLGGEADTADTPVTGTDTETYAITETVDLTTETAPSITETLALITETKAPETEPPKPTTKAPETQPPAPVTQAPVVTEAPKPTTQAPADTKAPKPAETEKPVQVDTITNITVTSPISQNSIATLTAKVLPNTEYDIDVYYSSGESKAEGLENKTSDANGNISWSWKVGQRTKPGTYKIVISGSGENKETKFTVTD